MAARNYWSNRPAAVIAAIALAVALAPTASAQYDQPKSRKERAAAEEAAKTDEAPQAEYSKEFRKLAAPVQTAANEKKWPEVLAALPALEALPEQSRDEKKAIATWRLQATQGVGDQDAFAAAIEAFLSEGFADPENVGAMHRQLAAHYSAKQDKEKTLLNFQKFVDATPDVEAEEYETLGRLNLQANQAGVYDGQSSHYSGDGFSGMRFKVHALPPERFGAWASNARGSGAMLNGKAYSELAKQSSYVKPLTYGGVSRGLFDAVVNMTAPPPGLPHEGHPTADVSPRSKN